MIDWNAPIEFDDGTPLETTGTNVIMTPKSPYRSEWTGRRDQYWDCPAKYHYHFKTGVFGGGSAKAMYTIRNVVDSKMYIPEDWS